MKAKEAKIVVNKFRKNQPLLKIVDRHGEVLMLVPKGSFLIVK